MSNKVNVAVIGAGGFCRGKHLPALARIKEAQLVGLCDRDETRLGKVGDEFDVLPENRYSDFRRMLDEKRPDAVYAIMAPHHIFDVAIEVLDRGHALFIEKPPGISTTQAESMAWMAEKRKVVSAIALQRRYHPLVQACWREVSDNAPIHRLRVNYHKFPGSSDDFPYYRGAVDVLRCDAIHAVDSTRYYAGLAEVADVQSAVRKIGEPYENCFQALITFENGVVAELEVDWTSGRRFLTFEFHSKGSCAYVDTDGEGEVWREGAGDDPVYKATCESAADSTNLLDHAGFQAEHQAFIDAVKTGRDPHNCLGDVVKTMRLIDAIYEKGRVRQE